MEATDKQLNYIEDLIKNLPSEEQQDILKKIHNGMSVKEASELIDLLKVNRQPTDSNQLNQPNYS